MIKDKKFDLNKFDFEDLYKQIKEFDYNAFIKSLNKPKKYTVTGKNPKGKSVTYTFSMDVAIEENSILHAVIENILRKTKYKAHAKEISRLFHKSLEESALKQLTQEVVNYSNPKKKAKR